MIAADVWPEAKSLAASAQHAEPKDLARTYDHLAVPLDQWKEGTYSHLFVWTAPEAGGKADEARDVTPGSVTDVPDSRGTTMADIQIAPDGKTLAFAAVTAGRTTAWQIAFDTFVVALDGTAKPTDITVNSLANNIGRCSRPMARRSRCG